MSKKKNKTTPSPWRFISNIFISRDKEYFVENLSMLLASGLPILPSLEAIKKESRSAQMQKIIDDVEKDIDGGMPLWKALEKTKIFSATIVSLIKIGEKSGQLAKNFKVIATQQQKDRIFKLRIRSALLYPSLVLGLTLVIGTGIAWFILPRLAVTFSALRLKLPLITKIVIGLGAFLNDYGYIFFPIFFLIIGLIFYFLFLFSKTKIIGQAILFNFPGIKNLIREVELSRFGYIFGNLLNAGLPIMEALDSLIDTTAIFSYKNFYKFLKNNIDEGNSFEKSFDRYKNINKLIPAAIQQLIVTGEQSGNLSETLLQIGRLYEDKSETTTKNLAVLLEPVLLVIVWLGVITVAIAVILPIYSLIGGL